MSAILRCLVKSALGHAGTVSSRQATAFRPLRGRQTPPFEYPMPNSHFHSWRSNTQNPGAAAALRGERLPEDLTNPLDLCTIHAIRHNDAFARSEAVANLCETSEDKRYARARNARLIMSNEIPDMATDDVKPYCFWHPDIASEETYLQLVRRYPELAYSVGRACAVAGYDQLYHKLGILPEISIAEEARESTTKAGSKAIFDHIMRQPFCYAVMDDYTRSVNRQNPRFPAFMNGDTAVRSTIDVTVAMTDLPDFGDDYFDIAEDSHVSEIGTHQYFFTSQGTLPQDHVELLYTPLPAHLPTVIKDPLIVMAAYEGNLDRYLRLRRPDMVECERAAVLRGIYHNTTFAKWWSLQNDHHTKWHWDIKAATLARFIMVNDLSHITRTSPDPQEVPGLIWWPLIPAEETLKELAERRPDMELQVAMACIAGNYKKLWDNLAPHPCKQLWNFASRRDDGTRNHFVEYLERRTDNPRNLAWRDNTRADDQIYDAAKVNLEPTATWLADEIILPRVRDIHPESNSIYGGDDLALNLANWELHISSSEELKAKLHKLGRGISLYGEHDREHWALPPSPAGQLSKEPQSINTVCK